MYLYTLWCNWYQYTCCKTDIGAPPPHCKAYIRPNHLYVYWSMYCFCTLHKCECLCVHGFFLMLLVYFCVFTCGWHVAVGALDEEHSTVFIDGRHGAKSHFLCSPIVNQLVHSSLAISSLYCLQSCSSTFYCFVFFNIHHFVSSFSFLCILFFFFFPLHPLLFPVLHIPFSISYIFFIYSLSSSTPSHLFLSLSRTWTPYEQHPPALLWTHPDSRRRERSGRARWQQHHRRDHETQQQPPVFLPLVPQPGPAAPIIRGGHETWDQPLQLPEEAGWAPAGVGGKGWRRKEGGKEGEGTKMPQKRT